MALDGSRPVRFIPNNDSRGKEALEHFSVALSVVKIFRMDIWIYGSKLSALF